MYLNGAYLGLKVPPFVRDVRAQVRALRVRVISGFEVFRVSGLFMV